MIVVKLKCRVCGNKLKTTYGNKPIQLMNPLNFYSDPLDFLTEIDLIHS